MVPAPRRPERDIRIPVSAHRLDFRLDVPLVAEARIAENLVARKPSPSERRREEEVPACLIDENRLLAPLERRIGIYVADLLNLPEGNHSARRKIPVNITPVERIRHIAPRLAQGKPLHGIVRRDDVVLAAQVEVASCFGEVERIERADVPQRGLDRSKIAVFALGVVFVRDIPRHDRRMVAQGRGEAAVVVLLPRPELLVRALFGRWIRDRRETYGAGDSRFVAEIEKLRRVVDVPQELDAAQLVFPDDVAVELPLAALVEIPSPRADERPRVALHTMAVPHERHAIRPEFAKRESRQLLVHDFPVRIDQLRDEFEERKFERTPQRRILPLGFVRKGKKLLVAAPDGVAHSEAIWMLRLDADCLFAERRHHRNAADCVFATRFKRQLTNRRNSSRSEHYPLAITMCHDQEVVCFANANKRRDVRLHFAGDVPVRRETSRLFAVNEKCGLADYTQRLEYDAPSGERRRDEPSATEPFLLFLDFGGHHGLLARGTRPSLVHPHEFAIRRLCVREPRENAVNLPPRSVRETDRRAELSRAVVLVVDIKFKRPSKLNIPLIDLGERLAVVVRHLHAEPSLDRRAEIAVERHGHIGRAEIGFRGESHLGIERHVRKYALRRIVERLLCEDNPRSRRLFVDSERLARIDFHRTRLERHPLFAIVVQPRPAAHELNAPPLVPHLGAGSRIVARKSFKPHMVRSRLDAVRKQQPVLRRAAFERIVRTSRTHGRDDDERCDCFVHGRHP